MLELLLSIGGSGSTPSHYPDSGPGTKTLQFGDQTAGYFGEVSSAELYDSLGVYALSQLAVGSTFAGVLSWLKFFIDNKVVYYAKQQVASGVCWNDVYSAGCALGIRGIGPYPVGAGVDQFRFGIVQEAGRDWAVMLRMPKTGISDPALVDTTNVLLSEWNRTLMRVVNGGWGTFTPTDLGRSSDVTSMCLETWTNSTTWHYVRGAANDAVSRTNIAKTQNSFWRPVLELLDLTQIALDPRNIEYFSAELNPPILSTVPPVLSEQLTNPADVSYSVGVLQEFGIGIDDVDTLVTEQLIWSIGSLNDFGFTTETI